MIVGDIAFVGDRFPGRSRRRKPPRAPSRAGATRRWLPAIPVQDPAPLSRIAAERRLRQTQDGSAGLGAPVTDLSPTIAILVSVVVGIAWGLAPPLTIVMVVSGVATTGSGISTRPRAVNHEPCQGGQPGWPVDPWNQVDHDGSGPTPFEASLLLVHQHQGQSGNVRDHEEETKKQQPEWQQRP